MSQLTFGSPFIVVGVVTRLRAGWSGFVCAHVQEIFFFSAKRPVQLWGTRSLHFSVYLGIFPLGQSPRGARLTTHLSSAVVKNEWCYAFTFHISSCGMDRGNSNFTFVCFSPHVPHYVGARGGVVVKTLRYKPAGRGFDSRWCHWNFSVT